MNLNGHEKRIRQLFLEMSHDDEAGTPSFESVLNSTRTAQRVRAWSPAIAWGLAMLVLAVVVALLALARTPKPVNAPDERAVVAPTSVEEAPPVQHSFEKPALPKQATQPKRRQARRTTDQVTLAIKSLSAWQSPTASLMKYPGEDLLKTLPRLGESLETIKFLSTDQFN